MIPRSFEYFSPLTLDEAIGLLKKLGPDAKLLSGGKGLIPMMKLPMVSPQHIVDLNRIPGLDYISESDGQLRIGALAREHQLETFGRHRCKTADTRTLRSSSPIHWCGDRIRIELKIEFVKKNQIQRRRLCDQCRSRFSSD